MIRRRRFKSKTGGEATTGAAWPGGVVPELEVLLDVLVDQVGAELRGGNHAEVWPSGVGVLGLEVLLGTFYDVRQDLRWISIRAKIRWGVTTRVAGSTVAGWPGGVVNVGLEVLLGVFVDVRQELEELAFLPPSTERQETQPHPPRRRSDGYGELGALRQTGKFFGQSGDGEDPMLVVARRDRCEGDRCSSRIDSLRESKHDGRSRRVGMERDRGEGEPSSEERPTGSKVGAEIGPLLACRKIGGGSAEPVDRRQNPLESTKAVGRKAGHGTRGRSWVEALVARQAHALEHEFEARALEGGIIDR